MFSLALQGMNAVTIRNYVLAVKPRALDFVDTAMETAAASAAACLVAKIDLNCRHDKLKAAFERL